MQRVIGPQASELIHEVIVAMNYRATVEQFMRIPHLHPTLAEIWTYPAEECAARCGMRQPGDEQIEVATSGRADNRERLLAPARRARADETGKGRYA